MDTVYIFANVPDPLETLGWVDPTSRVETAADTQAALRLRERWGDTRDLDITRFLQLLWRR